MSTHWRVGHGFDAHRFRDGGRLILGGVEIDHPQGLAAHSDGDCLLHAITDAVLGASALGDLGQHFPDTDPTLRGVDSGHLLRSVLEKAGTLGLAVENVDATVIAQRPKLSPYREAMHERVAELMGLARDAVNLKATTTEGMGFTGRGEGIAATAVVMLRREGP